MFDKNIIIKENFKTIWKKNKISGHSWPEHGKTTGYTVTGGGWMSETFRSLKKAELEKNGAKPFSLITPIGYVIQTNNYSQLDNIFFISNNTQASYRHTI